MTILDGKGWEPDYAKPATHGLYWVNEVIGLSKQWDQHWAYGEARIHQRILTHTSRRNYFNYNFIRFICTS